MPSSTGEFDDVFDDVMQDIGDLRAKLRKIGPATGHGSPRARQILEADIKSQAWLNRAKSASAYVHYHTQQGRAGKPADPAAVESRLAALHQIGREVTAVSRSFPSERAPRA